MLQPRLYLGGLDAATEFNEMKRHGITHVLNVAGSRVLSLMKGGKQVSAFSPNDFTYKARNV